MATKRKKKTPAKRKTSRAQKKASKRTVTFSVYVRRGRVTDPIDEHRIPADLTAALERLAQGTLSEGAANAVAQKYVAANFLVENLDEGDELFKNATEVWSSNVEVNELGQVRHGLPSLTATAAFTVEATKRFPPEAEAFMEWQDDHGYLSEAVNFFWRFGDTSLVVTDHDESGGDVERFP